jgi:hypothetical protein
LCQRAGTSAIQLASDLDRHDAGKCQRNKLLSIAFVKLCNFVRPMFGERGVQLPLLGELQINDATRQLREASLNEVSRHDLRVEGDI